MKFNSKSAIKNLSKRKASCRTLQKSKRFIDIISAQWIRYLKGGSRPPLTCIIVGGINEERKFITY